MNNRNSLLTAVTLALRWLPLSKGPLYGVLRAYLATPKVTRGQWKMPLLTLVNQHNQ